jgi:hypothetical protein
MTKLTLSNTKDKTLFLALPSSLRFVEVPNTDSVPIEGSIDFWISPSDLA